MTGYHLSFDGADSEREYAKEAAEVSNIRFIEYTMSTDDALVAIQNAPKEYIQPFIDFSTIGNYHLHKMIISHHKETTILLDGSGAEPFLDNTVPLKQLIATCLRVIPKTLRKFASYLYSRKHVFTTNSLLELFLRPFARSSNCYRLLQTEVLIGGDGFFEKPMSKLEWTHGKHLTALVHLYCTNPDDRAYYALATLLTRNGSMCKKSYKIGDGSISTLYPFLFKSPLIEQGYLPWSLKNNLGISKYPLKKILAKYMRKEFIHRKKGGLCPPMESWLMDYEINKEILTILRNLSNPLLRVLSQKKLIDSFLLATSKSSFAYPTRNFLWGVIFAELWLRHNTKEQSDLPTPLSIVG